MQLVETFQQMIDLLQSVVLIMFIQLIFILAVARNTQVVAKSTSSPPTPRGPSILRRFWRRLRPSIKLPEGDKKELTEK